LRRDIGGILPPNSYPAAPTTSRELVAKLRVPLPELGDLRPDLAPSRPGIVVKLAMTMPVARLPATVRAGDRVVTLGKEFALALLASHRERLVVRRAARNS
jgi:hypothetical protein